MDNLKPCPFCGGEATLRYGVTWACVICDKCTTKGPTVEGPDYRLLAATMWNTRYEAATSRDGSTGAIGEGGPGAEGEE